MKKLELTTMNIYLGAAIELIPKDELLDLVQRYDREATTVTVASLSKLFEDYGEDFAVPFANLALEHANTESAKEKMTNAARKLQKASGTAGADAAASGASSNALGWFNTVSKFIIDCAGGAGDIIKAVNGTDAINGQIILKQWEAKLESEKTTRWIIIGAVGFVLALITLFVIKQMFGSRH